MISFEEFEKHARTWRIETRLSSSITEMVKHGSYQAIIKMGAKAIPWIMEDLEKSPDHWHHALAEITGQNPVPEFAHGDIAAISHVWLEWGKCKGYFKNGVWSVPNA